MGVGGGRGDDGGWGRGVGVGGGRGDGGGWVMVGVGVEVGVGAPVREERVRAVMTPTLTIDIKCLHAVFLRPSLYHVVNIHAFFPLVIRAESNRDFYIDYPTLRFSSF